MAETQNVATAVAMTLLDKLKDKKARDAAKGGKPTVVGQYDEDNTHVLLSIPKEMIVGKMGPSASGKSEGITVVANGDFTMEIEGQKFNFEISQTAWVTIRAKA